MKIQMLLSPTLHQVDLLEPFGPPSTELGEKDNEKGWYPITKPYIENTNRMQQTRHSNENKDLQTNIQDLRKWHNWYDKRWI